VNLSNGGSAELSNRDYKLVQFHFHTPSEEKIDGKNYPMVAHLVHRDDAGNLAVIAVLFKRGRENAALKSIFQRLPAKEGEVPLSERIDATKLLPPNRAYYAFRGSLTTPPCSEGVSWYVLKQAVEMSAGQIGAFKKVFKMNARPVQPLNAREVVEAK
jgi:carbonic anhydrase